MTLIQTLNLNTSPDFKSDSSFEAAKALRMEKVGEPSAIKRLQRFASKCADLAKVRLHRVRNENSDKESLAYSVKNIWKVIRDKLKNDTSAFTIYVAKDESGKVQGVALASIASESDKNELLCLASHPRNVALFPREKNFKGVGRKLLTEVAHDLFFKKSNNERLHLKSQKTASKFYEQFGFIRNKQEKINRKDRLVPMLIERKQMAELLEKSGIEVEIEIKR